jgi:hypothetical protein
MKGAVRLRLEVFTIAFPIWPGGAGCAAMRIR